MFSDFLEKNKPCSQGKIGGVRVCRREAPDPGQRSQIPKCSFQASKIHPPVLFPLLPLIIPVLVSDFLPPFLPCNPQATVDGPVDDLTRQLMSLRIQFTSNS